MVVVITGPNAAPHPPIPALSTLAPSITTIGPSLASSSIVADLRTAPGSRKIPRETASYTKIRMHMHMPGHGNSHVRAKTAVSKSSGDSAFRDMMQPQQSAHPRERKWQRSASGNFCGCLSFIAFHNTPPHSTTVNGNQWSQSTESVGAAHI